MGGIGDILSGHLNELFGLNKDIASSRLKICRQCPLCKKTYFGLICNNKLWINPKTGDISNNKKDGYVNGCGCRLSAKTTEWNQKCPIGKW